MKRTFAIVLCLVCGFASAQTSVTPQPPQTNSYPPQSHFDHAKSKRLAHIGTRIQTLQNEQACIQAATDFASMQACRPPRK